MAGSPVRTAFKTPAGYIPKEGNRELLVPLDFSAVTSIDDDLTNEQRLGQIEIVQSVFIDNSLNAQTVTIQFLHGLTQKIVAPALSQGCYPVLVPGALRYRATSTGGVIVPVVWSNTKREFSVWGPVSVNVALITVSATPLVVTNTVTNKVLTGGVDVLLVANANRKALYFQGMPNNAGPVAYAYAANPALGTFPELGQGQSWTNGQGPVDQRELRGIGTAGDIVTIMEGV